MELNLKENYLPFLIYVECDNHKKHFHLDILVIFSHKKCSLFFHIFLGNKKTYFPI